MHGTSLAVAVLRFATLMLLLVVSSPSVMAGKADRCSAEGQPPCPIYYKGPPCDRGLGNFGGICKSCGGEGQLACPRLAKGPPCAGGRTKIDGRCYAYCGGPNQKACPRIKLGYPCRGSFEPDENNFCRPCGGEGEKACRALKAGRQCQAGLSKIDGKCFKCGGEGEPACPILERGKQCNTGLSRIDGKCWRCGRENQRACPWLKPGKQCEGKLANIDGWCHPCGGPNEHACPKIKLGYPCHGKYEPDRNNICKPCGGNHQKACRALKAGKRCNEGLTVIGGICQACGGPNERACPRLKLGFPCHGNYEPDSRNICKPCGGPGQKACRVLKKGRQCVVGYTSRGGVCVACGGLGQRGCRITDKGSACQSGLKLGLNGICKKGEGWAVREAGLRELKRLGSAILPALGSAMSLSQDRRLKQRVANRDDAAEDAPDNGACPANFRSMSVGLSGEVGVGINVEGEAGIAWRCGKQARDAAKDEDDKNAKWYTSTSMNFRAGGGATGTVTFGWWVDEVNRLRGESHGYVLDLVDAVQLAQALKAKDFSKLVDNMKSFEPDVAIGMWFERRDEDGDGDKVFEEVGRFLGFTFSIGASAGADIAGGGTYVKARTSQKCDLDMKCAEGIWQGRIGSRTKTLYVDGQTDDEIYVSIDDGEPVRFDRKTKHGRRYDSAAGSIIRFRKNYTLIRFEGSDGSKGELKPVVQASVEGVWAGEVGGVPTAVVIDAPERNRLFASVNNGSRKPYTRGRIARRTYKSADGEVIRFRKNYTVLKFKNAEGEKGELTPGSEADVPSAPSAINVLGEWDFTVKGRRLTEEFVAQSTHQVSVRRVGSDLVRHYDKSGENSYSNDYGGTFRFVSASRGIWIGPDRRTVFQLSRRE